MEIDLCFGSLDMARRVNWLSAGCRFDAPVSNMYRNVHVARVSPKAGDMAARLPNDGGYTTAVLVLLVLSLFDRNRIQWPVSLVCRGHQPNITYHMEEACTVFTRVSYANGRNISVDWCICFSREDCTSCLSESVSLDGSRIVLNWTYKWVSYRQPTICRFDHVLLLYTLKCAKTIIQKYNPALFSNSLTINAWKLVVVFDLLHFIKWN